jgi:metal-responsive CopG/Arc/MetJ family transcriptional regulator
MAKSSAKKRVGRPPTGKNPQVIVRLPKQLLSAIEKLARDQAATRSEIMRQLMTEALAARKRL